MIFRDDLLEGRRIVVAGTGAAISTRLQELSAWVQRVPDAALFDEEAATAWMGERTPLHGLVFDAGPAFATGAPDGLSRSLRHAWITTRAAATAALIPGAQPGKVTLIAPRSDAGDHASATRAALENLARTLSVEWARFGVTAVAVCPGTNTTEDDLSALVCFLHSVAGDYLSGCRFDLDVGADTALAAPPALR